MTTLTQADLAAMGRKVVNGVAVKVAPDESPADADVSWQEMQRKCHAVFVKAGCAVYWLSQSRKTRQTPGVPDLIVFGPPGHPFHAYWETKSGRGKLEEAQRKFALHCQRTNTEYQCGSAVLAGAFLKLLMQKYGTGVDR